MEVIGHRGARFEAPENTIEAFRHAISLGLTTVEFDVRITADDELVVIHDATVDRTTNGTGAVSEMTLAEIEMLDARSMHTTWPNLVRVPTLAAVLQTLRDIPHMQVEIKHDTEENLQRVVPSVVEALRKADKAHSAVITSFDPYALELAASLASEIQRGMIGDFSKPLMWYLARKLEVGTVCMGLRTASRELVERAHSEGYRAVAWPCNDEDSVRKVIECGFEEACTDAPSIFGPILRGMQGVVSG